MTAGIETRPLAAADVDRAAEVLGVSRQRIAPGAQVVGAYRQGSRVESGGAELHRAGCAMRDDMQRAQVRWRNVLHPAQRLNGGQGIAAIFERL